MVAILFYDTLLLISALLVAAGIAVALNGGDAISAQNPFFLLYLLGVIFVFYGWFWTHGGQTLGMRAWQVYLVSQGTTGISWPQAAIRFTVAILSWLPMGLGFWWQWLSPDKLSWHDMASGSELILYQRKKSAPS
ncbi:putative membrane protein/domain protein [Methylophaga frappieri]|uniref:Putative membrane protein/domain protein n=2 Tax=Methylophaga frappieri (strain ATCC BAA-2434 / DSM 25690 / JAM7) TaxID=754477 RepID=I1YEI3_METFJ|nr:putative membrane protein/domain protein [Methylophaga frappieri]